MALKQPGKNKGNTEGVHRTSQANSGLYQHRAADKPGYEPNTGWRRTAPHRTAPHRTTQRRITLHNTATPRSIAQRRTAP
jgi:hypothetical protein